MTLLPKMRGLIDAALFGHWTLGLIPAASLLAKAAIAASPVAA
jgi:hypothetical protein